MRKHWRLIGRIIPYLRPHKTLAGGTVVITVTSAILALAEPWPLAFLIDGVLGGESGEHGKQLPPLITQLFGTEPRTLILVAVVAGFLVALMVHGVSVIDEYVKTKLSLRMTRQFRSDLFNNALRQSVAFHDARSMGDFIARINYEASAMGGITVALPPLVQSVLTLGGMAYITYRIDSQLALLAMIVVPFIYYSTGYYGKHIEPRLREVRGNEGASLRIVYEAMSMLRVISVFNRASFEYERFDTQAAGAVQARVRLTLRQSLFSLVVALTTAAGTALVLGVGALHVLEGKLSVGEILVLLSYIHSVYGPLEAISHSMASFQEQFIYLAMSLELLDEVPSIRDAPGAVDLPPVRGAVEFDAVNFAYEGRQSTLEDISFRVEAGEAVAVVGPTGAGKTTLMSLLSRLCQPDQGRVLIDGIDIRTVTLSSLRDQVSVVPQEPSLFTGTVSDNIRYGRLDAPDEDVVRAAIAANAHDFIMRLPHQYDTLLGENGTALSGGEKQRLCVARAFLKDAPILVLDEPTSSIDSRTEAAILDALEDLMKGRTTFVIAHRLSTLRSVERIVVLDHGRLVEQGTHVELLRRNGLYRALHDIQANDRSRYHDDDSAAPTEAPAMEDVRSAMRTRVRLADTILDRLRPRLPESRTGALLAALGPALRRPSAAEETAPPLPDATFAARPNPIVLTDGAITGATELVWTAVGCTRTEVRIGAPDGPLFAVAEDDDTCTEHVRPTGDWVTDGMTFFLQNVSDGQPLTRADTLATVAVRVVDPAHATPMSPSEEGHGPELVPAGEVSLLRQPGLPPGSVGRSAARTIVLRVDYGESLRGAASFVRALSHDGRRLMRRLLARGPQPSRPGGKPKTRYRPRPYTGRTRPGRIK